MPSRLEKLSSKLTHLLIKVIKLKVRSNLEKIQFKVNPNPEFGVGFHVLDWIGFTFHWISNPGLDWIHLLLDFFCFSGLDWIRFLFWIGLDFFWISDSGFYREIIGLRWRKNPRPTFKLDWIQKQMQNWIWIGLT